MKTTLCESNMFRNHPFPILLCGLLMATLAVLPRTVSAQSNWWTNTAGGSWETAGNWSSNAAPTLTMPVLYITNNANFTVKVDDTTANTDAGWMSVSTLIMGQGTLGPTLLVDFTNSTKTLTINGQLRMGGSDTLIVSNGTLQVLGGCNLGYPDLGLPRTSWIKLFGGTSTLNTLVLGYQPNNTVNMLVAGGTLNNSNYNTTVGSYGRGVLTVSNGTVNLWNLYLGNSAGASGEVDFFGGTNTISGNLQIGANATTGRGSMLVNLVNGGLVIVTNGIAYVANTGLGTLTVSNGTFLTKDLRVGNGNNSTGSVSITGSGVLEFQTTNTSITLGGGWGAITNQNGGTLRFTDQNDPSLTVKGQSSFGSFVVTNATLEFLNASAAKVRGSITNITIQAGSRLRLNTSTNAIVAGFTVGGAGNYAQLELAGANSLWQSTNLTVGAGGAVIADASAQVSVLGTYQNMGSSIFSNLYTVASGSRYQSWGGATNQFAAGLTIASGGGLDVTNGPSVIGGTITNAGRMTVFNAQAIYNGNVVNQGAYVSDPSTNTFNGNYTVGPTATVVAAAGDIYAFGSNFVMGSSNRNFNMVSAQVVFASSGYGITTGTTNHTFDLTGSGAIDVGSNILNIASMATNFGIGTLSIASNNNLTVMGSKSGSLTNALYVGWLNLQALEGAGITTNNMGALTNGIFAALTLPNINLYYDKYVTENAYLGGLEYNLWGTGGGLLIPIPEPSPLLAAGAGLVLLAFLRRRRDPSLRSG